VQRGADAENITSLPPRLGIDDRLRAGVPGESSALNTAEPKAKATQPPIPPMSRSGVSNQVIAYIVLAGMAGMALLCGVYIWRTVLMRRLDDFDLPKTQAIDVPLIARLALGVYVLVMALMIIRGWNRRERRVHTTNGTARLGNYGIPALALMVLLGVGLALVAIQERPVRGPLAGDKAGPESVPAVLPSQLAALGYLPDDVHLVVGFHIAEAWRTPAGRPFLDGSHPDGGLGLDQIESLSGLKLAELDHAVLAVRLDKLLPRIFLIVRTTAAYDPVEIQNDLKATKLATGTGRSFYEFKMKQVPDKAGLWFADDRKTLVVVWPSTEMKEIPQTPHEGLHHLPDHIRSVLEDQIDPAARAAPQQVWAVGHTESWTKMTPLAALTLKWPTLADIRTVGLWVHLGEDADLHGVVRCSDTPAAENLRAFLQPDKPAENKGLDVLLPKNSLMAADLTKTLKVTEDGEWLELEATISAPTIRKALGVGK
jgi:hypothetical protein